jgi:hypothetical protein
MRTDRDPVSVLLPTVEWGTACDQLAAQLRPGDELLVLCDSEDDPVASHDPPDGVEVVVAGDPEGCSGKANAMAAGMERAENDRFVWTDDDFDRGDDWLDRLVAGGEKNGPTSVLPYFVGTRWWWPLEPVLVLLLGLTHGLFWNEEDAFPWGGGVTFARDDLREGVESLVADLRSCLSDDTVLDDHLPTCRMDKSMTVVVEMEGDAESVWNRLVRWMRADHVHGGLVAPLLGSLAVVAVALSFPLVVALGVTLAALLAYRSLGLVRWTFVLAYPGLFLLPPVLALGVFVDECEWGGRRYRVDGAYDVEVLESG